MTGESNHHKRPCNSLDLFCATLYCVKEYFCCHKTQKLCRNYQDNGAKLWFALQGKIGIFYMTVESNHHKRSCNSLDLFCATLYCVKEFFCCHKTQKLCRNYQDNGAKLWFALQGKIGIFYMTVERSHHKRTCNSLYLFSATL